MKTIRDFHVGDTFRLERTCDRYRPVYYAAGSGDFNPIHIDPEVGRLAGQPGAILQGMCTMAWLADACLRYFGDPGRLHALRTRFSRPVDVGDTVTFEGRCVAVEGPLVRVEVAARNQKGEEVLKGALAEAVFPG
ncbi:MAG TPA: MaoC/PaaZ C-terminal domain-containing protein [Anaeromyxobacteraceae bacterium]|nr:MaoC/PaaZ C-terminal domain-containing protein [Anaeromyxobacteraceae bacterium]